MSHAFSFFHYKSEQYARLKHPRKKVFPKSVFLRIFPLTYEQSLPTIPQSEVGN
jgi:hypothetical protein